MKKVYQVRCEVNDHGFNGGYYLYENAADARQSMRDHIARQIYNARWDGKKIDTIVHYANHVMDEPGTECEGIFLRIGKDIFDYRVWALELRNKPLEKSRCFNY